MTAVAPLINTRKIATLPSIIVHSIDL
jgi:hypothetical protein